MGRLSDNLSLAEEKKWWVEVEGCYLILRAPSAHPLAFTVRWNTLSGFCCGVLLWVFAVGMVLRWRGTIADRPFSVRRTGRVFGRSCPALLAGELPPGIGELQGSTSGQLHRDAVCSLSVLLSRFPGAFPSRRCQYNTRKQILPGKKVANSQKRELSKKFSFLRKTKARGN